jgi:polyisoprenoid-binding protein YceI
MRIFCLFLALLIPSLASAAEVTLTSASGKITFLMDAPVEKIKGEGTLISSKLTFNTENLATLTGTLKVDVSSFKTSTFDDAGKNATQTEHMLNWFEIGPDVAQAKRNDFKTATLTIKTVTSAKPSETSTLLDVDATLTLHGITKDVKVAVSVMPEGKTWKVKTLKPFLVKLADFEVKPRDLAGQLLQKGLEALGQKVASEAQVSVDATIQ